jgi:two-component system response regulator
VDDNPVDVLVTRHALEETEFNVRLHVVEDGEDAVDFLYQNCNSHDTDAPCPDLILLDINLPRKNGKEVLKEIKRHPDTSHIPVVILTTSEDPKDICETYSLHASCYITKPVDVEEFTSVVQSIRGFWTEVAKLPSRN